MRYDCFCLEFKVYILACLKFKVSHEKIEWVQQPLSKQLNKSSKQLRYRKLCSQCMDIFTQKLKTTKLLDLSELFLRGAIKLARGLLSKSHCFRRPLPWPLTNSPLFLSFYQLCFGSFLFAFSLDFCYVFDVRPFSSPFSTTSVHKTMARICKRFHK